jgi:hypothetical protein
MNKTLVTLGVGIWGVMLLLSFIFRASLAVKFTPEEINANLLPLTVIEIVAFIIAVFGIIKRE